MEHVSPPPHLLVLKQITDCCIDCECIEVCQRCLVTFKKPSTFWAHRCATSAKTAVDKAYFRMRTTALRRKVKKELDAAIKRSKRGPDALDSERLKRRKLKAPVQSSRDDAADFVSEQSSSVAEDVEATISTSARMQFATPGLPLADPSQSLAPLMAVGHSAYGQQHQLPLWLGDDLDSNYHNDNTVTSTPAWLLQDSSANTPSTLFQPENPTVSEPPIPNYQVYDMAYKG